MRKKYKLNISVENAVYDFADLAVGDLFVDALATPGMSMGRSMLWIGFDIWVKTVDPEYPDVVGAYKLGDRSNCKSFHSGFKVLEVEIDNIDNPGV